MRYRQLGQSGLTVSVLGLGCNNFGSRCDEAQSRAIVDAAINAGVTFFDVAENYGGGEGLAERYLGAALKGRRDQAVIATKFGSFTSRTATSAPSSRRSLVASVEGSLGRLGVEAIDLLYMHQPDPSTPIEETLRALDDLIVQGKVRYIAAANRTAWQIVEAELTARLLGTSRFIGVQNAYSLLDRMPETDVVPVCEKYGLGLVPYYALAAGMLSGRYAPGEAAPAGSRLASKPLFQSNETATSAAQELRTFAGERGLTVPQVALGGLLAKPTVSSVLAGASAPEHVQSNALATEWVPSAADVAALDEIARPVRYAPLGSRTGHMR
jgi:aryl-alcohol dehydrogenase-like predicted oxidoreductase